MSLRLIEVIIPEIYSEEAKSLLQTESALNLYTDKLLDRQIRMKAVLPAEETERVMDSLEKRFSAVEGFRLILLPVEASIPRLSIESDDVASNETAAESEGWIKAGRISREELYHDIDEVSKISYLFVVLVILSAVVATVGIIRSNVAIVIGAMVIAPLLGPNVSLAFATTLGDKGLAVRSIKVNLLGILLALIFSAILGVLLEIDPTLPEIASRTVVGIGDVILALAAGCAATLSFTAGMPGALIGVMVAVALLPPLVTLGMLLGAGYWHDALGAGLLLATNLICINLSGVTTFLIQGVGPLSWWETGKAKKAARNAILIWTSLLGLLVLFIVLSRSQ